MSRGRAALTSAAVVVVEGWWSRAREGAKAGRGAVVWGSVTVGVGVESVVRRVVVRVGEVAVVGVGVGGK